MKPQFFALLALLVIPLGLAACDKREVGKYVTTFEEAPCPVELPQSVIVGKDIVCGYVTVPEEHAHPDGDTIRLAVAVIKSTGDNPSPDPLVIEAGGPGGSTLASIPSMLSAADLRARRDIVLVEQRGTLYSDPYLLCKEISDVATKMLGQGLSVEEKSALETEALTACRDRLIEEGVNLSAYDSLENAADIVMALTALGYDEFNFYGVSYSTMLAQHLMRDYPHRLRSVILDSVAPLSVNGFVQLPNSADRAFRLLFESCEADPACNQHFPNLETVFFDLVEELNKNPVTVRFGAPWQIAELMTGDRLIGQLFDSLQQGLTPMLPATIYALADGETSLMTRIGTPRSLPKAMLINGMTLSVLCAEEMDYTDADFDLEGAYPQIGTVLRDNLDIRDYCAVWNVEPLSADVAVPVVSDIPTLIMSGEFDPNTPPSAGSLVAETLSNSYAYTLPGISHSVLSNSICAQSILLDFLDDPTHEPDASCIADMGLQFIVPTDDIELQPFTDKAYGIRGVLPAGWANVGPGLFVRLSDKGDLAYLLINKLPNLPLDQHLTPRLQRLGLDALPESSGHYETAAFTWDLYAFEGNVPSLGGKATVDYAIAQTDAGIYLVGLYAPPSEYEGLHEAVFLPVVDALAPLE
jgi:pimeloyl-ACP methyl ester carboxylesterase